MWDARLQLNDPRPGSFYGSFCEGYGQFWSLLGKILEELSSETVEKVTKSRLSEADSHVDSS